MPATRPALLLLLAALTLAGCKPDAALKKSEVLDRGPHAAVPPGDEPQSLGGPVPTLGQNAAPNAPAGSISGTVSFKGTPPPKVLIDTSMDPACGLSNAKVYSEQFAVTNGNLANVFLYIKQGPAAAMQAGPLTSAPVVLDQRNCQYTPHVIGVMQGGSVSFHNSDVTMHNIHTMPTVVGNETIDISQGPKGAPQTHVFARPELMMPVRCNNHPWMNAFINVSETPFFAVSDAQGRFTIANLPPGDYTLGAVQEKLGERTIQLTVKPNSTTKADFSFSK